MNLQSIACLVFLMLPSVSSLLANYYYSGNGGFTDSCQTTACITTTCPTGSYRKDCGILTATGGSAAGAYPGVCTPCTLAPAYSSYNAYTAGVTVALSDATCPFTCDADRTLISGVCTPSTCPAPSDTNKQLVSGTVSPACNTQCKAGRSGNTALNPTTCTVCSTGSSAPAGSTVCTLCAPGNIAASTGMAACTACAPTVGGIETFASSNGLSACTTCEATCPNGQFKYACGGSSAGVCSACTA